jgi:hypothetical protein
LPRLTHGRYAPLLLIMIILNSIKFWRHYKGVSN